MACGEESAALRGDVAKDRIHSVDILRGLLAVGVMLYHYSYWLTLSVPQPLLSISHKIGIYAVEGFFVLSGFSLYWAYRERAPIQTGSFSKYIVSRIFRLAPLFVLAILLSKSINLDQVAPSRLLANVTLTLGFFDPSLSLIVGGWSIGVEMVLSSLLPIFIILQNRMHHGFLAVVAASFVLLFFWQGEASYMQAPNHLLFFVAGVYLGFLRSRGTQISTFPFWAGLFVLIAAFCLLCPGSDNWVPYVEGLPRAALTAITLAISGLFCLYEFRPIKGAFWLFTLLGEASYSVYLLHPLVFERLATRFPVSALQALAICAIATIGIAVLTYYQFEKRALDLRLLLFRSTLRPRASVPARTVEH